MSVNKPLLTQKNLPYLLEIWERLEVGTEAYNLMAEVMEGGIGPAGQYSEEKNDKAWAKLARVIQLGDFYAQQK